MERVAKLFRNGRSQAVRIPQPFRFEGTEVVFRREGERVYLDPTGPANPVMSLGQLLDSWEPIDDESLQVNDIAPTRVEL